MSFSEKNLTKYLTQEEIKEAKAAFKLFDQDGSGSISIREFDQILKSLGQNLQEEELDDLVRKIDQDGNGFIDFDQFLYLVAPKIINKRTQKDFITAFRTIDYQNRGELGLAELTKANLVTGANLSLEQIKEIMSYVQQKFSGHFGIDTVLTMLQRNPELYQNIE